MTPRKGRRNDIIKYNRSTNKNNLYNIVLSRKYKRVYTVNPYTLNDNDGQLTSNNIINLNWFCSYYIYAERGIV